MTFVLGRPRPSHTHTLYTPKAATRLDAEFGFGEREYEHQARNPRFVRLRECANRSRYDAQAQSGIDHATN